MSYCVCVLLFFFFLIVCKEKSLFEYCVMCGMYERSTMHSMLFDVHDEHCSHAHGVIRESEREKKMSCVYDND